MLRSMQPKGCHSSHHVDLARSSTCVGRKHPMLTTIVSCCATQAAEAAEAAKVQAAKAAALAQKQVQMEQLEHMKQRILEERYGGQQSLQSCSGCAFF